LYYTSPQDLAHFTMRVVGINSTPNVDYINARAAFYVLHSNLYHIRIQSLFIMQIITEASERAMESEMSIPYLCICPAEF
jgi:hypothetical protein